MAGTAYLCWSSVREGVISMSKCKTVQDEKKILKMSVLKRDGVDAVPFRTIEEPSSSETKE